MVLAIPVEPGSVASAFPSPLARRIEAELRAMRQLVHGAEPEHVQFGEQRRGLVPRAEDIVRELEAIGRP